MRRASWVPAMPIVQPKTTAPLRPGRRHRGQGDAVGCGFDLGLGVAHCHAQARRADHGNVVHIVTDGADLGVG